MKSNIKFDHYDYIVIRMDSECGDVRLDSDISVQSFDTLKHAKDWMKKDYEKTIESIGREPDQKIEDEDGTYKFLDDCGYQVEWDLRKIHHRTEGTWNDPEYTVNWKKV